MVVVLYEKKPFPASTGNEATSIDTVCSNSRLLENYIKQEKTRWVIKERPSELGGH